MNNKLTISTIAITLTISAGVLGQETSQNEVTQNQSIPDTTCLDAEMQYLFAAKDPQKRIDQDWNLKAAQAARQLFQLGGTC